MSSLWYPFTAMQDLESEHLLSIVRADGCLLVDESGNQYIDGVSSLWTNIHGHNHPVLNNAIIEQTKKVAHSTLLGLTNPEPVLLAQELVEITPDGLNHVFYSDSGSSAVEIALKQAFQASALLGNPEKTKFVHLEDAYHGDTLGAVSVGGIPIFHAVFGSLLNHSYSVPSPSPKMGESADISLEKSLLALENLFIDKSSVIAALIIEPLVQGAGGILVHPVGWLSAVSTLCTKYNIFLIADEVATGFGRTGKLFACDHEEVTPDLLCLAKGITGGYLPLAATLSSDKIFNAFLAPKKEYKTFFHGHTYTGNAIACAVARANLKIFKSEKTIDKLQPKITHLKNVLNELKMHPNVGEIRQRGFMVGIELVQCKETLTSFPEDQFIGYQVCKEVRKHGVILRNLGDVLVVMPPLTISLTQLTLIVDAIKTSIGNICK